MKSSLVSIVGRPSSGKSTLLNTMCGQMVSIVAEVPQTTRNKIRGILTEDRGQFVFIDTPGFHHSERKFNLQLKDLVVSALEDIDVLLYVIDLTRPPGIEEDDICTLLSDREFPIVIALNKIDLTPKGVESTKEFLSDRIPNAVFVETSALSGTGVPELLDVLFEKSPEGEQMYPDDIYTDQEPQFRVTEIIREQAITRVSQEVPHALYVEAEDMEISADGEELWVRATINVERESQKGILVGKGGSMIKAIRQSSQKVLNRIFPYKVHLDLRVKVDKKWRRKDQLLRRMMH